MQRSTTEEQDDSFYVERLKGGDSSCFEYLFHRYEAKLYHFCWHLTRTHSDAEDIVQETFIKVWEVRHRLDPELSFSAYLIQIAKHLVYDKTSQRLREHAYQHYHLQNTPTFSNVTQEEINVWSTEEVLNQLIDKLPFMQRRVLSLSRFHDLSNKEIADRLQLSKSTVENHIHLALKSLRKHLLNQHLHLILWLTTWLN